MRTRPRVSARTQTDYCSRSQTDIGIASGNETGVTTILVSSPDYLDDIDTLCRLKLVRTERGQPREKALLLKAEGLLPPQRRDNKV